MLTDREAIKNATDDEILEELIFVRKRKEPTKGSKLHLPARDKALREYRNRLKEESNRRNKRIDLSGCWIPTCR